MLIAIVIIYLPFLFIEFSTAGYFLWILFATIISIYAVGVVILTNLIFEKSTMQDMVTRVIRMVRR